MNKNIHHHRILILDFGSQYTQLIARRVREIGVYCELWAWDVTEAQIRDFNPTGIILSGGPESVTEAGSPRAPAYVFEAGVPVLGVCYGMQTMAEQLGGRVQGSDEREFGYAQVEVLAPNELFAKIEDHIGANGNACNSASLSRSAEIVCTPAASSCARMASSEKRETAITLCDNPAFSIACFASTAIDGPIFPPAPNNKISPSILRRSFTNASDGVRISFSNNKSSFITNGYS